MQACCRSFERGSRSVKIDGKRKRAFDRRCRERCAVDSTSREASELRSAVVKMVMVMARYIPFRTAKRRLVRKTKV